MNRPALVRSGILGLLLLLGLLKDHPAPTIPSSAKAPRAQPHATSLLANLPLAFVKNQGQWETEAKFLARKGGMQAWFEPDAITLQLTKREAEEQMEGIAVRLAFEGASPDTTLNGETQQAGVYNYFIGNDPTRWKTNVPGYAAVRYAGLYEGINIRVREHEGRLEYDLLLEPDADLRQVVIRTEGTDRLELTDDGFLLMHTALGLIEQKPPTTWYELASGERQPVKARFVLLDESRYGFEVPRRNTQLALVIDPGLEYSTFLGGPGFESADAVALNLISYGPGYGGWVVVAGGTSSPSYPTTPGAFRRSLNGTSDAVATFLQADPGGSAVVYSTFLGGSSDEGALDLAIMNSGGPLVVTVVGSTDSPDFPTTPGAYDRTYNGGSCNPFRCTDGFMAKLSLARSGSTDLVYSTYFGGTDYDHISSMALDASGSTITVAGSTNSSDLPTTPGAFQPNPMGRGDVFVAWFNPMGNGTADLVYSTYLGGFLNDSGRAALGVDGTGMATVAGYTSSLDFPTTQGAYDRSYNGSNDVFVARLRPAGSGSADLVYSTYFGGSSGDVVGRGKALALDASGIVTLSGETYSIDLPTTQGAYDRSYNGGTDAFVARLNPAGSGSADLVYSTFLGGSSHDIGRALALDASGTVTTSGITNSSDFPTTLGAYDVSFNGGINPYYGSGDTFVTRLRLAGREAGDFIYSTFIGGSWDESPEGIALDGTTASTVVGSTQSPDFPVTSGALQSTFSGAFDMVIVRLDMHPSGVIKYGDSTNGGSGQRYIAMGATYPQQGNRNFKITSTGGCPNASGYLLLSLGQDLGGTPFGGIRLHVDLWGLFAILSAASDATSYAEVPIPLGAAIPQGIQVFGQFVWLNTAACGGANTFSASNALDITVQP